MNTITRRAALGAIGLIPIAGVAVTAAAAAEESTGLAAANALARAEWHFAELVRLLDHMEPTELHVVLQRIRETEA